VEGEVLKIKKKVVTITEWVKNIAIASYKNTTKNGIKANLSWAIIIDNKLDIVDKADTTVIAQKCILADIKQVIDKNRIIAAILINE